MSRVLAAFVALAVLPLAACGSGKIDEWPGPPRAAAGGSLDVAAFNDYLAEYDEYARSPIVATTEFLRLDEATTPAISIEAHAAGESPSPVRVDVTLDRLQDDSVRARRYALVLNLAGENDWRLSSAVVSQRCWPNRGHQTFSAEPCV